MEDTILKVPDNCIDCQFHRVIPDPDPNDWFCDDDCAVICTLSDDGAVDTTSKYRADWQKYRTVTVSCRPYNTRKESNRPIWCKLIRQK